MVDQLKYMKYIRKHEVHGGRLLTQLRKDLLPGYMQFSTVYIERGKKREVEKKEAIARCIV